MADRVDARVQSMQASGAQSHFDCPPAGAEPSELPPPHHPMLHFRQLSNPSIERRRLL